MAVKRHFTVAAVAVVLLLCMSSAIAATPQETDPKAVDAALASITASKTAADASKPAVVKLSPSSGPAAAEHGDKNEHVAAVSEPQHAPQFPEEPSLVRKGQEKNPPSAPTPTAPKEQQPAVAPVTAPTPAAAAPSKPEEPKQQQEAKSEPKADAPKSTPPTAEAPKAETPKSDAPKSADTPKAVDSPKAADTPKAADAPKADAPKAVEAPKSDKKDEATDAFEDARRKNEEAHKKPEPEEKKEPENPCKRVPGCMECKPFDPKDPILFEGFGLRRLRESWDMNAMMGGNMNTNVGAQGQKQDTKKLKNRVEFNPMDMVESPYSAKDLPLCTACNTTGGYVQHSRGRCACKPGYGDTAPTGNCHRCPHGYFSQGGFRAVCVECEGVAFSNSDHTACVCASGWYGVTSYATKQASCNQCPGTRPVSKEGARSSSECKACPEGEQPNEIYSDCVDPTKIPEPIEAPDAPGLMTEEEAKKLPTVKPLYNSTTFEKTREEWTLTSRNTQNHTNLFTDFIGSIMDSVMMNKNVTATARTPGEMLYQMISKPAAPMPKMPTLPNIDVQNPAQLGAGVGAALSAVPAVLGGALQSGGKISDVVESVTKAVETGSQAAGNDMAATSNGWDAFLKGLSTTAPKDSSGKSELADFAKSLGDLFGAAGKVATDVASKSDNTLVKSIGGMLSAAKNGETVEVPLTGEAAKIAAPDDAPAKPDNSWSGMLSSLLSGNQQAAAPAAPAAEAPAAAGSEWTKVLSGWTKTAPAPAEPAPAAGSGSTSDILKMLSGLTAQKKPERTGTPSTITVNSAGYRDPDKLVLSNSAIRPDAGSGESVNNILKALNTYTNAKVETRGQEGGDSLTTLSAQKTHSKDQPAAGSFSDLLGGLLGKPAAGGKKTFSFANLNGGSQHLKDKVLQAQAQAAQQAAEGFISVPSAPPKGSAQIKSGKIGAGNGKAKAMGGNKKNKAH